MTEQNAEKAVDTIDQAPGEHHPQFELKQSTYVESLGVRIDDYEHKATKARHIHLASTSKENVFVVAFPTLPVDSTGVAHILEHTVLCGSETYPVRDPFFMMMRRSLSTFMNAFTSSDWTAFPFATENKKDFNNLLGVYLDAAFFSRLHPLDFAQEGHRLEFAQGEDPTTPLEIKGVVYNEMKGAMSSPVSQLYQRLKRQLFATTTYHFNSGGEPNVIPRLTYDQLLAFYETHYHPTNGLFCTFGDIPALEHQTQFEDLCLSRFEQGLKYKAPLENPQFAPTAVEESYAFHGDDATEQCHFVLGWLMPEFTNGADELAVELLSTLLSSNSAAPLRKALETSDYGSPSPLTGLMNIGRQGVFGAGFQGCAAENKAAMQALIMDTLQQVVADGFDQADVEAGLFQMELYQKQITGHSQPYGLELALDVVTAGFYDRPVRSAIDIGPAIEELKNRLQNPAYLQALLQTLVLDNQHHTSLLLTPDATLSAKEEAHEKAELEKRKAALTPDEISTLVDQAKALNERQAALDDADILPKLELTDIPKEIEFVPLSPLSIAKASSGWNKGRQLSAFERKTNGLVYFQTATHLPQMEQNDIFNLNALHRVWAEVGAGSTGYLDIQKQHFANTGYLTAGLNIRPDATNSDEISAFSVIRASTLHAKFDTMLDQLSTQLYTPRFDELDRLRELLQQQKQNAVQSIAGRGHSLALNAANAGYHALSSLNMDLSGLYFIQHLNAQKNEDDTLAATAEQLQKLHARIVGQEQHMCLIGDTSLESWIAQIKSNWNQDVANTSHLTTYPLQSKEHQVWLGATQINFCAMSLPAVDRNHPDAPALDVLSVIMKNEFLHTALREKGGAYGGGASANSRSKTFDFYTYRDPRIKDTFDDFERAMDWAKKAQFTQKHREEAILSMISGIDKPGSPSGAAIEEFHAILHRRTVAERQAFRQAILDVDIGDLQRVAQHYFNQEQHTKVVVTNKAKFESEQLDGFTVHEI